MTNSAAASFGWNVATAVLPLLFLLVLVLMGLGLLRWMSR